MAVFTDVEFINKLSWLVYDVPNYYYSKNGTWCNYNKSNGKFMMDCVVSIKGLLWGFKADKNKPHGGGVAGSNGVADFTANGGIEYCTEKSQDFSHIVPGEYLCMAGTKTQHAGVYLGNGKVFECTTSWGAKKCIISDIDRNGNRFYNGKKAPSKWTWHGKLRYIDYSGEPEPPSTDWTPAVYELLYNKCIRKTHKIVPTNIVQAKNCTAVTKKHLVSQTGNAMLKAGTRITCRNIYNENGRIWGSYGNCWVVICNIDGTPQATKISEL